MSNGKEITPYIDEQAIAKLIGGMNTELENVQKTVRNLSVDDYTLGMTGDDDLKQCKTWLSTAIRDAKAAKTKFRKEWQAPMNKVGELFDAELTAANELLERYKGEFDKRETEKREARTNELEAVYTQFCENNGVSTLAQNVPFERIFDKTWLNGGKAWNFRKVAPKVEERAAQVLADFNVLQNMELFDTTSAQRDFFNTLDLSDVLAKDRKRKDDQAALEAFQAQQASNKAYTQAQSAAAEPAPAEPQSAPQTPQEPTQCTPATESAQPAQQQAQPQTETAPRFEFNLTLIATDAQFSELLAHMRANNIKGSFKKNLQQR